MKKWYEYEAFEDYWNDFVPTSMRTYATEEVHKEEIDLKQFKKFWELEKEIVLRANKMENMRR